MAFELEERLVENVQTKEQKVNIKKYGKYTEFKSYVAHTKKVSLCAIGEPYGKESEKW